MDSANLHTYLEGAHVGQFTRTGTSISFRYDDDQTDTFTPLSLSLPRNTRPRGHVVG
jgi:HipA-like protein